MLDAISTLFPFLDNEKKRKSWVKKQLEAIPQGENILDAGAGECQYKHLCNHLKYVSQDFCSYDGKGNDEGLQTRTWDTSQVDITCDIEHIPLEDSSYDNILCTEVIEHIPHPDRAIKEFSRILKQNVRLILTAPFCSQTHFAPYHYHTGFNSYWYEKILQEYGFTIMECSYNGNFFDYICQELVRIPLVIKKYSPLSYLGFTFYLLIIPLVMLLTAVSRLAPGTERQLCFGYHIIAKKTI